MGAWPPSQDIAYLYLPGEGYRSLRGLPTFPDLLGSFPAVLCISIDPGSARQAVRATIGGKRSRVGNNRLEPAPTRNAMALSFELREDVYFLSSIRRH